MIEGKPLVLLQVNCRSIHNKTLDFWNIINKYNLDVVIGKGSWLGEEINNADDFSADYTNFRRDRHNHGGGIFNCVKHYITCAERWVDEVHETIAVEVKGRDPKIIKEILGIYRTPKQDMRL
jgi:hypothetical protein